MNSGSKIGIIDITENSEYERYIYKCFAPILSENTGRDVNT